jgi:hypothetical protein
MVSTAPTEGSDYWPGARLSIQGDQLLGRRVFYGAFGDHRPGTGKLPIQGDPRTGPALLRPPAYRLRVTLFPTSVGYRAN